jgi:hypothetical protein
MSNKYLLPLIVSISILFTGAVTLIQSRNSNNKVAIVNSSSVVGGGSPVVSSSSQVVSSPASFESGVKDLSNYTLSGNINTTIPFLLNINSESEAEYEYNGVSESPIPLKILNKSQNLIFQENSTTYFELNYIDLQGSWTDGKNTYPVKMFKTDRLNISDITKMNQSIKNKKSESIPTFIVDKLSTTPFIIHRILFD